MPKKKAKPKKRKVTFKGIWSDMNAAGRGLKKQKAKKKLKKSMGNKLKKSH